MRDLEQLRLDQHAHMKKERNLYKRLTKKYAKTLAIILNSRHWEIQETELKAMIRETLEK